MGRASSAGMPWIDAVWQGAGIAREGALVLAGSLLIALSALVQIPLPFSPVPITGQTLAVLLLGALYGSRRGASTAFAYLTLGLAGLPVFAGGAAGLVRLLGPTGGYLMSYIPVMFIVGWLAERGWDRRPWTAAASMVLGNIIIYACGALWLARFVSLDSVWELGVLPFLPGDALKIALATALLPLGWRFLGRRRMPNAGAG